MKVVALTSSFPHHSNDERSVFVRRMYDAVARLGVELTVVAPHPFVGELAYEVRALSRSYSAFGDAGLLRTVLAQPLTFTTLPFAWADYAEIVRQIKPDVVHANWTVCGAIAAASEFPSVVTLRGSDVHILKSPIINLAAKFFLRNAGVFTAVGSALAATAARALGRAVLTIENGTELAEPEEVVTQKPYLVSIGTVSAVKDTLGLVRAFSIFSKMQERYSLLIAGRLSDQRYVSEVRSEIDRLGIADRVSLLGAVTPGQVSTLLGGAAGYCGFSVSEGRPNAVLEAQVAGLPCLLSAIPAHQELVGGSDILCDPSDSQRSAEAMTSLIERPRRAARPINTWNDCAARYVRLYRELLSSAG